MLHLGRNLLTQWWNLFLPTSGRGIQHSEDGDSSFLQNIGTFLPLYSCCNPEDSNLHGHCHENFKYNKEMMFWWHRRCRTYDRVDVGLNENYCLHQYNLSNDCNTDALKLLACSVTAVLAPQFEASLHLHLYRSPQDGYTDVLQLLACSAASPLALQVEASHCVEWFVCCFVCNGTVCYTLFGAI